MLGGVPSPLRVRLMIRSRAAAGFGFGDERQAVGVERLGELIGAHRMLPSKDAARRLRANPSLPQGVLRGPSIDQRRPRSLQYPIVHGRSLAPGDAMTRP